MQNRLRPLPPQNPSYAGDITPELAWQWVQAGEAVLVDIRSEAERAWVGFVPELEGVAAVAYKSWPSMAVNPAFEAQLRAVANPSKKLLLLCRSGVRSIPAAQAASSLGFEAYNILEGFEGDADTHAHRSTVGGWKFRGLPWKQN